MSGVSNAILSIEVGDEVFLSGASENTVRCAAWNLGKRWGRKFRVSKTADGIFVRREHIDHLQDAAPELLAALQGILRSPNFPACNCGLPECKTTQARAAVARATGGAA